MTDNYSEYTDAELVVFIKQAKPVCDNAFMELYRRYSSQIRGYAKCMTLNSAASEEIFQETFIALFKNIKSGAKPNNIKAYLYSTVRNLCSNDRRNRKTVIPIDPDMMIIDERQTHEQNELLDLIIKTLPVLDEKYREAFILREFDGLQYSEIAEITGTTVSGAKTRVARAHRLIQNTLEPYLKDLEMK